MDCGTPGFPVHHQLPELAQTRVHWVNDAIQPSHPLLPPSPPAFNLSHHQGLFIRWPKYWSFNISFCNEYSGLISFEMDWLDLLGRDSPESCPTPQFESISSLALSLLYGPTLTSVHDYWKTIALTMRIIPLSAKWCFRTLFNLLLLLGVDCVARII